MKRLLLPVLVAGACLGGGCGMLTIKHEVKPIYATIDINIRVQKELEEFFDFEETRGAEKKASGKDAGKGEK